MNLTDREYQKRVTAWKCAKEAGDSQGVFEPILTALQQVNAQ